MNPMSTKPFVKKTFYLDLKGYPKEERLAKDLKLLGGKQDHFLNKEVSFVVSNRIPLKPQFWMPATPLTNPRSISPQFFADSPLGIDSPSYTDSPGNEQNPCIMSRGMSLLQKAREKKQAGTSDIIGICKQWNIKVYHVQKVLNWVEKYKCLYHQKLIALQKHGYNITHVGEDVQRIHAPYIKIEDENRKYLVKYKCLTSWTDIIDPALSQFVSKLKKDLKISGNISDSMRHGNIANSMRLPLKEMGAKLVQHVPSTLTNAVSFTKTPVCNMSFSNSVSVAGHQGKENYSYSRTKRKGKDSKRKTKKRYCEICDVHFSDLDAHLMEKSHEKYTLNADYYKEVQDIISTLPQVEDFLMKCISKAKVEMEEASMVDITEPFITSDPNSKVEDTIVFVVNTDDCNTEMYCSIMDECISGTFSSPCPTSLPYLEPIGKHDMNSVLNQELDPPTLVYYNRVECAYIFPEKLVKDPLEVITKNGVENIGTDILKVNINAVTKGYNQQDCRSLTNGYGDLLNHYNNKCKRNSSQDVLESLNGNGLPILPDCKSSGREVAISEWSCNIPSHSSAVKNSDVEDNTGSIISIDLNKTQMFVHETDNALFPSLNEAGVNSANPLEDNFSKPIKCACRRINFHDCFVDLAKQNVLCLQPIIPNILRLESDGLSETSLKSLYVDLGKQNVLFPQQINKILQPNISGICESNYNTLIGTESAVSCENTRESNIVQENIKSASENHIIPCSRNLIPEFESVALNTSVPKLDTNDQVSDIKIYKVPLEFNGLEELNASNKTQDKTQSLHSDYVKQLLATSACLERKNYSEQDPLFSLEKNYPENDVAACLITSSGIVSTFQSLLSFVGEFNSLENCSSSFWDKSKEHEHVMTLARKVKFGDLQCCENLLDQLENTYSKPVHEVVRSETIDTVDWLVKLVEKFDCASSSYNKIPALLCQVSGTDQSTSEISDNSKSLHISVENGEGMKIEQGVKDSVSVSNVCADQHEIFNPTLKLNSFMPVQAFQNQLYKNAEIDNFSSVFVSKTQQKSDISTILKGMIDSVSVTNVDTVQEIINPTFEMNPSVLFLNLDDEQSKNVEVDVINTVFVSDAPQNTVNSSILKGMSNTISVTNVDTQQLNPTAKIDDFEIEQTKNVKVDEINEIFDSEAEQKANFGISKGMIDSISVTDINAEHGIVNPTSKMNSSVLTQTFEDEQTKNFEVDQVNTAFYFEAQQSILNSSIPKGMIDCVSLNSVSTEQAVLNTVPENKPYPLTYTFAEQLCATHQNTFNSSIFNECNSCSSVPLRDSISLKNFTSSMGVSPTTATDILNSGNVYYVLDEAGESDIFCNDGSDCNFSCQATYCCFNESCLKNDASDIYSLNITPNCIQEINDISSVQLPFITQTISQDVEIPTSSVNVLTFANVPVPQSSTNFRNDISCSEAEFSSSPEKESSWTTIQSQVDNLCKSIIDDDNCVLDLSVDDMEENQQLVM